MKKPQVTALTGILALFSAAAFAASPIPNEIYSPADAVIIKAELPGQGEFEAVFRLNANQISVKNLARQVRRHARSQGFHEVKSSVQNDDAELKFKREDQALDISIEQNRHGMIDYKADLDLGNG